MQISPILEREEGESTAKAQTSPIFQDAHVVATKTNPPAGVERRNGKNIAAVHMRKIVTSVSSDIREGHEHLLIGKLKAGGVTSRQASYQRSCPPRIPVKAEATIFHRNKFGRGKFGHKIFGYVTFLRPR